MTTVATGNAIRERESRHSSGVYAKRDLAIVRGDGSLVWDEQGNRYIDCTSGYGTAILGHANPRVRDAIAEQAGRLIACQEAFYNDQRAELLAVLAEITPDGLDRFFLCNSGSEANEAALKFARLVTGRSGIVATQRGFHGRSMGALSATWEPQYRRPFEPLLPNVRHVPFGQPEALDAAIDESVGAVMLEPVQGEGGVRPAPDGYLALARDLCLQRGAMLILDEVQTGFGRTGTMFACQRDGMAPDMLTMAKGMANGLPIGAVALGGRVGPIPPGTHGSTFGGNPLACAASLATIAVLRERRLSEQAAAHGMQLLGRLQALRHPLIREVRGRGLMLGIELRERVRPYLADLMARGVLALPAGATTMRLLPPLIIDDAEMDAVVEAIDAVLAQRRVPGGNDDA